MQERQGITISEAGEEKQQQAALAQHSQGGAPAPAPTYEPPEWAGVPEG
jgi:hypothetical protein